MRFGETGGETGGKKPEGIGSGYGWPPSIPVEPPYPITERPQPIRREPAPPLIETPPIGERQSPPPRSYIRHLRTEIGRSTDEIYEARCAQARFAELMPQLLDLSKLLESYFWAEERVPQRRSLSAVEGRYVIEAGKLIPWEELAEISGLGSDHPAVTNLRPSLENRSLPPGESREAVVKLRDALIAEAGDGKGQKRRESATPYVNEATEQESAGLRLADSLIRIGLLVAIGGAIGGVVGAAIVGESIKAEVIKCIVGALAAAVAEEAIYPSIKRRLDSNPRTAFEQASNRLEKKLRDLSDTSPERPTYAVAKSEVIISAQAARATALEIHWDDQHLYDETLRHLMESMKSDVKPDDLLNTASDLRHLGRV
jgi:hypothetical protein